MHPRSMAEVNDTSPGSAPEPPAWQRSLRRVFSRWVILVAIGGLVIYTLMGRPVTIEVSYAFGRARSGLQRATMRYLQGDEEIRRVHFDYARQQVPGRQPHQVQLPPGEYTVRVELLYARDAPRHLGGTVTPRDGGSLLTLRRPLLASGSRPAIIFIDDSE